MEAVLPSCLLQPRFWKNSGFHFASWKHYASIPADAPTRSLSAERILSALFAKIDIILETTKKKASFFRLTLKICPSKLLCAHNKIYMHTGTAASLVEELCAGNHLWMDSQRRVLNCVYVNILYDIYFVSSQSLTSYPATTLRLPCDYPAITLRLPCDYIIREI